MMCIARPVIVLWPNRRGGMVYIAVFGAMLIVLTLLLGAMFAGRARNKSVSAASAISDAQQAAFSGLELARVWIDQDTAWRTNRVNGVWATDLPVGKGSVTITVTDPLDSNLANRPYDSVVVTATGKFGRAVQTYQQTLIASPTALDSLAYALISPGQLHVRSGNVVGLGTAALASKNELRNDGTVEGRAECGSNNSSGYATGGTTTGIASKTFPGRVPVNLYAALGTELTGVTKIDKNVLGPGYNPYGSTTNADGVYVIRSSADVTLTNSRIYGTLVVLCPGKKLTIGNSVYIEPARSDYPALIVDGDLVSNADGTAPLSEAAVGVNLNPAGAPYLGVSNSTSTDTYPCEIRGLVHTTGAYQLGKSITYRGAIVAESTANSDAIDVSVDMQVVYPPSLLTSPPQGYTSRVRMVPQANSVKQVVN